ncbi:hypothetical protein ACVJGD_005146 [Bradyrhizobium sp. USDA 10063]
MFFAEGLDRLLVICPTGTFCIARATTHTVIPGRRKDEPGMTESEETHDGPSLETPLARLLGMRVICGGGQ